MFEAWPWWGWVLWFGALVAVGYGARELWIWAQSTPRNRKERDNGRD